MGVLYNSRIVTDGLVLCLDAGDRMSYPGAGTTWTDLSKNRNNGTLTNGPTFNSANGGSLAFDGTDDYVDLGSQVANLSTFTLSYWINPNQADVSSTSLMPIGWDDNYLDRVIYYSTRRDDLFFWFGPTSADRVSISYNTVNDNTWYNFVITRGSTYVKMYQDNILLGQSTTTGDNVNFQWIGKETPANIALLHVYNRALTPDEIRQNYKATKGRFGL